MNSYNFTPLVFIFFLFLICVAYTDSFLIEVEYLLSEMNETKSVSNFEFLKFF
jgi:hypothetical protein